MLSKYFIRPIIFQLSVSTRVKVTTEIRCGMTAATTSVLVRSQPQTNSDVTAGKIPNYFAFCLVRKISKSSS